jgi:hypothetical protein
MEATQDEGALARIGEMGQVIRVRQQSGRLQLLRPGPIRSGRLSSHER